MNTFYKLISAAGVALLVGIAPVSAVQITGDFSYSGAVNPTPSGSGLYNADGLDFTDNEFEVEDVSGDFGTYISVGDTGTINDFTFDPFAGPIDPLWSIGGFDFRLDTVTVVLQQTGFLSLYGTGIISGNGFDETAGYWRLSAQSGNATYSFSGSTGVPVPETLTLTLFGIGLLGLGGVIRRKKIQMS